MQFRVTRDGAAIAYVDGACLGNGTNNAQASLFKQMFSLRWRFFIPKTVIWTID
jgi:hypothetical protein